jgi:hypothetical protein
MTARIVRFLPVILLFTCVLSLGRQDAVGQGPKKETWQDDYASFAATFAKAVLKADPKAPFNEFDDLFAKKQIRWKMNYTGAKDGKDGLELSFDGVPQTVKVISLKSDEKDWRNRKVGSPVTVEAKCKIAFIFTLNPNTDQARNVGIIIFDQARIAEDPKK